jgi:hypothetical protein
VSIAARDWAWKRSAEIGERQFVAKLLLLRLAEYVHRDTAADAWLVTVGARRLGRELGVRPSSIAPAARELEALRLLERVTGMGQHKQRMSYRLVSETVTVSGTVSGRRGEQTVTVSGTDRNGERDGTVTVSGTRTGYTGSTGIPPSKEERVDGAGDLVLGDDPPPCEDRVRADEAARDALAELRTLAAAKKQRDEDERRRRLLELLDGSRNGDAS